MNILKFLENEPLILTRNPTTYSKRLPHTLHHNYHISSSLSPPQPSCSLIDKDTVSCFQFSLSVASDSLRPHKSQHARLPCPSPTPRVYSNSCPLSRWCHPAISSSVVLYRKTKILGGELLYLLHTKNANTGISENPFLPIPLLPWSFFSSKWLPTPYQLTFHQWLLNIFKSLSFYIKNLSPTWHILFAILFL